MSEPRKVVVMDSVAPAPIAVEVPAAPPAAEAGAERKVRPFLLLGVFVIAAAAGALAYTMMHAGKESTDDAQVEADVVVVSARISGRVAKVLVQDNQHVKAGDELVVLEDADFSARVAKAEAELAIARAEERAAEA